jgi:Spy/CpxP family protein refolding chaperone
LLTITVACLVLLFSAALPAAAQHEHGGAMQSTGGMSPHGMAGSNSPLTPGTHSGLRDRAFGSSLVSPVRVPHASLQLGLGGRWWDDHKTGKKLSLRTEQQQHMDAIFEANKPTLLTLYANLQREQATLAAIPSGDLQDESRLFAAIDRVSQARSDLEKENVHMLIQIRQQLDPQQLQSLEEQISKQQ